jgi:methylated-DNA-[protein]-cysteine S-methyltransferase
MLAIMNLVERHRILKTPTGDFAIVQRADGTIETGWVHGRANTIELRGRHDAQLLPELTARLNSYFCGEGVSFDDLPLPRGGDFARRCWAACREIPRGRTISYADLAERAGGSRSAARAAGQAMRRNPQPIITPCHRVVGSNGRLHGFAGSISTSSKALGIKRFLLEMEGGAPQTAEIVCIGPTA